MGTTLRTRLSRLEKGTDEGAPLPLPQFRKVQRLNSQNRMMVKMVSMIKMAITVARVVKTVVLKKLLLRAQNVSMKKVSLRSLMPLSTLMKRTAFMEMCYHI